jgi:hypothetical protein
MCTAFIHRGNDVIFGFNMDINVGAFRYDIHADKDCFCIGCPADLHLFHDEIPPFYQVENSFRKIHGVNRQGAFAACLNNMNFHKAPFRLAADACSLDQLTDDVISGRRTLKDVGEFAKQVEIVTLPGGAVAVPNPGFHALMGDADGGILVLEPGNGYTVVQEKYAVMTNFPLLELPTDLTDATAGYYGRDRYNTALEMLREAGDGFTPEAALRVLESTKQTGRWATRVSFVYSCREKTVFWCLEGAFDSIHTHCFR